MDSIITGLAVGFLIYAAAKLADAAAPVREPAREVDHWRAEMLSQAEREEIEDYDGWDERMTALANELTAEGMRMIGRAA